MARFDEASPRIRHARFVFEDTAINAFAIGSPRVDGNVIPGDRWVSEEGGLLRVNPFNSHFPHGRLRLGDRHIVEFKGARAELGCVDAKICPNRRWIGIESAQWGLGEAESRPFESEWGAPYGERQATLVPNQAFELKAVFTDVSVAYVDRTGGGKLRILVDGQEKLVQSTREPFVDITGRHHFMENRKGVLDLGFGWHSVRLEAIEGPVDVLGVFTYDARANHQAERRSIGFAAPGETIRFTRPFKTRPVVICHGELNAKLQDVTPTRVTFGGDAPGGYEVIGE